MRTRTPAFSHPFLFACFALATALLPTQTAHAGDVSAHVTRTLVQTEGEKVDLCLELDHDFAALPLDAAQTSKPRAQVTLNGDVIDLASKKLALAGNQLCLRGLEHRRQYRLHIDELVGADGFHLSGNKTFVVDVPPRTPALSFPQTLRANGLVDWDEDVMLRSVNVHRLSGELYAVTDTSAMAEAWQQRLQTTLAPSESATFARTHGTLVKKWERDLENNPDTTATTPLRLHDVAPDAQPGLYLLTVTAADNGSSSTNLKTAAALWIMRGTLNIQAMRDKGLIAVTADSGPDHVVATHVAVTAIDGSGKDIAKGETDGAGTVLLHLPENKVTEPVVIIGRMAEGDIAFTQPAASAMDALKPPALDAHLTMQQRYYRPGEAIHLDLTAHDPHGQPVVLKDSLVQMINKDGSVYATTNVKTITTGHGEASLTAPAGAGLWKLIWLWPGQLPLAESAVRVSHHPDAPLFKAEAEQNQLPEDGKIVLHIRSLRDDGGAAPYVAGVVHNGWQVTRHVFSGWDNVEFGNGAAAEGSTQGDTKPVAHFVTDAHGQATLYLKLNPPRDLPTLAAAALTIDGAEKENGNDDILAASPVILSLKPHERLVGLRATQPQAHFAENGTARFDVIVLSADGKRSAANDLSYRIYDKGRSFAWHQAEGKWDYTLETEARLLGSHTLTVPPNGIARIEWPVTSGTYRLDVLDGDDQVVASLPFSAGWKATTGPQKTNGALDLHIDTADKSGQPYKIRFELEKPALVTVFINDGELRQIIHTQKPAGKNEITVTPAADWGQFIAVHVTAILPDTDTKSSITETGDITINTKASTRTEAKAAFPAPPTLTPPSTIVDKPIPDMRVLRATTLLPGQSWAHDDHAAKTPIMLLLSGASLGQSPAYLTALLHQPAERTQDIIDDINTLRLLRAVIVSTGLMSDGTWQKRFDQDIELLLSRQLPDGSFDHDAARTAAAVTALSGLRQATALDGHERATTLLKQKLEDSWVDDKDRPARAAIYAALAGDDNNAIPGFDPAGLRYFSDGSLDKALPPLAAAQLSYAFQRTHDDEHAKLWLQKADCLADEITRQAACLAFLARNPLAPVADIEKALTQLEQSGPQARTIAAAFLTAHLGLVVRSGVETRIAGIVNKNGTPAIKNSAQQPVVLTEITVTPPPLTTATLQQTFYRMDGNAVDLSQLRTGETYVRVITSPDGRNTPTTLSVPGGGLLAPASCAIATPDSGDFMGWTQTRLGNASLTPIDVCEWLQSDLHMTLPPHNQPWAIISLWRAVNKGQNFVPPVAWYDGEHPAIRQSAPQKIIVH